MASRPLRIVKFQPKLQTINESQPIETTLVAISRTAASPNAHLTSANDTMRTPPAVSRETLLQHIAEIRAGLAEIQEISKRIDAKRSIDESTH